MRPYSEYPPIAQFAMKHFVVPFIKLRQPVLYNLRNDPGETKDVALANPEVVQELERMAVEMRKELGEYLQRGHGQRPTGSIYPGTLVISHDKDTALMSSEMIEGLKKEWERRHPHGQRKKKRERGL